MPDIVGTAAPFCPIAHENRNRISDYPNRQPFLWVHVPSSAWHNFSVLPLPTVDNALGRIIYQILAGQLISGASCQRWTEFLRNGFGGVRAVHHYDYLGEPRAL